MKKITGYLLIALFVIALLSPTLTVFAADPIAKSVTLKSNGDVVIRANDDIADLTDGDKVWSAEGKNNFNIDGIVLFQNTKTATAEYYPLCELIIDLGTEKAVDTVNITFYHYYSAIIDTPKDGKITISYSIDGVGFSEIETYTMERKASASTSGIFDENIPLGERVNARYIMVSMQYGDYPQTKPVNEWFGFTELSAGTALQYGEEESIDISEEPPKVFGDLYITQINESVVSASGTIFTRGGVFADEDGVINNAAANLAFMQGFIAEPTETDGVFKVTEKLNNVPNETVVTIPEGGFVYAASGDSNTESLWYEISAANVTATNNITVGTTLTLEGVDLNAKKLSEEPGLYIDETEPVSEVSEPVSEVSDESDTSIEESDTSAEESIPAAESSVADDSSDVEKTEKNNTWVIILIVIGGLAVIGVAAYLINKSRKK